MAPKLRAVSLCCERAAGGRSGRADGSDSGGQTGA